MKNYPRCRHSVKKGQKCSFITQSFCLVSAASKTCLNSLLKKDTRYQKDKKRKQCRRRAAIEPIIGDLNSDYRMVRNYLKGAISDRINLLMAACHSGFFLFVPKTARFASSLMENQFA